MASNLELLYEVHMGLITYKHILSYLREGFDKDQPGCSAPQNFLGHFSKVLPTTYIWVGDFGSGDPRGPRGRGVKFRGVIKGHLWQIFKSLVLGQFLSK